MTNHSGHITYSCNTAIVRKKWRTEKEEEIGEYRALPLENGPKFFTSHSVKSSVVLDMWHLAPPAWNRMFLLSMVSSSGHKNSLNVNLQRLSWMVSVFLSSSRKKQSPMTRPRQRRHYIVSFSERNGISWSTCQSFQLQ